MAVVDHVLLGLLFVQVLLTCLVVVDFGNHVHVDWDWVLANVDSVVFTNFDLLIPGVGTDSVNRESLLWVGAEDFSDQVLARLTHKVGYLVFSIQDFVIQLIRLGVFKREETANHSIDDDSTAPHIRRQAIILLASNHFRSCIAGTTTGRLQKLTWLVCVTQAKINNLDIIEVVHQKILRLQIPMANA